METKPLRTGAPEPSTVAPTGEKPREESERSPLMESVDEYQKLVNGMNTPRVTIDNSASATATLVKVDSARKTGVLLEAVQALTDLDLSIKKAYISSDGRWFMDVFHVTDRHGRKLKDDSVQAFIENSIGAGEVDLPPPAAPLTALELTGNDRPGLLSEIFAVLSDQRCRVVDAKVWTHKSRVASLIFITDEETRSPITDTVRIHHIEARLCHIVKGDADGSDFRSAAATVSNATLAQADRRLHQMMFADGDYENTFSPEVVSCSSVSVNSWIERGYSVVHIQCKERPKLLLDVVCTLTDMKYVVFHGTIDTDGRLANQEFYIKHVDGSPIRSEAERQRVICCLRAAIERRSSEGLSFEMRSLDRKGLLAEVSRTLRENGLSVTMAEVSIKDGMAVGEFHVTEAAGHPADPKIIQAVIDRVGANCLKMTEQQCHRPSPPREESALTSGAVVALFYLGSFVKRNLYNLGLIRSCS